MIGTDELAMASRLGKDKVRDAPFAVIHVPHSARSIPDDVLVTFLLAADELKAELLAMTDHFTDELFSLPVDVATTVRFPVSRLVVDPERFVDDDSEPMACLGMGAVYTMTSGGLPLRRSLSTGEREQLLDRFYRRHHVALTDAVSSALGRHTACLIIDAHSFASMPLMHEPDQSPDRPDICIGTDVYHTPSRLRGLAVEAFKKHGFDVAVNRPFGGSLVPMRYYGTQHKVFSVMIEVNRRLYINELTGQKNETFDDLNAAVSSAVLGLIEATHGIVDCGDALAK